MAPAALESPQTARVDTKINAMHTLKETRSFDTNSTESKLAGLDASKLMFETNPCPRSVPIMGSVESGKKLPTDHMITCEWSAQTGWATPKLGPYQPIMLEPTASVFHYATECFEGMKLFRGQDNTLRLFRPDLNATRFRFSSTRCALPSFDPDEMVKLIVALCQLDGPKFLPSDPDNQLPEVGANYISNKVLYIRPTMIGTDADLGVKPPNRAMLFIIMATFPSLDTMFLSRSAPGLKLLASPTATVRAWPGGFGGAKLGANYGPSMLAQGDAARQGYDQVLWLYSQPGSANPLDLGRVTEAGASNFFVVWKRLDGTLEICTAPISDGTILEGVTRRSVLDLARERLTASLVSDGCFDSQGQVIVSERWFTILDILQAAKDGRALEAFATGTAYFITPVQKIHYQGIDISFPTIPGGIGPVTSRMRQWLRNIQFGVENHEWAVVI